ncbi:MAG: type II toxin-antitoxin system VapC family toxin [Melioribacteraceae bacterium]|nr:type II toxin-antitoxin system VapC family toxin [Melioribacteraceae bacterium]
MESSKLLIDTSIIIDFLRKKKKKNTLFWKYINQYECYISTITHFELLCGANTDLRIKELDVVFNFLTICDLNKETTFLSAKIFQNLKKENLLIEFRDIFIAATASSLNMPIATLNKKDFSRIDNLELL